ncbi:DNA ligase [Rhizobium sp. Leaf384]|uniref:DNA ligase D n=1 Tax=unclassified Rhizobium TaxID=2613769 RepID=UPI0007152DF9|nr:MULTISPECIES: DNA ligase D [unclassified Rhizobium]KQS77059.1 DNA ligase [Rhizobium sp. Leaf384]KQS78330.1 DNA ligase [Rhizobium sp. Leaf383]
MSLDTYNAKRRFDSTPEPKGEGRTAGAKKAASQGASFVIQKHDATRLHYDFRLEMEGVLKSWAVTKGPSLNPEDKRLAVHVEDHPLAYGDFEGVIPKGQYGGGTVIVWDRGTWTPIGDLTKAYRKGHLEFTLEGEKLRGRWHLVRMHGRPGETRENWLLIKSDDEEARNDGFDILEERPESVKSGRDLKAVGETPEDTWNSKRAKGKAGQAKAGAKSAARKSAETQSADSRASSTKGKKAAKVTTAPVGQAHAWPKGAKKGGLPDFVEPALASLKPKAPSGDRWVHEIKFDGYRLQARIDNGQVRLLTRSGLDWTERFGDVVASAFAGLPLETALIDGEIVVQKDNGASDFSALQEDLSLGRNDRFLYYAFDLLHLDGHDLTNAALIDRKNLLQKLILTDSPTVRFSEHFEDNGDLVLTHACRLSLEGVVSKERSGKYLSGRNGSWIKSKCSERQEFVIGGYAPSSTSDHSIGALALGVYEEGELRHVGRVGTGFSHATADMLFEALSAIERKESPFRDKLTADARRGLHYVEPKLVAEVEFRAWSADGNLRHASFRGLREDKPATEVRQESPAADKGRKPKPLPKATITLTHPDRLYWPKEGVKKQGLAEYYAEVWPFMAPYVVDRPLSLLRCPDGIDGKQRFFQKHAWRGINKAIDQIKDPKDKGGEPSLRITDFDGLIALVQSAALEIHPWGTTTRAWEKPDMITMDLDPGEDVSWAEIIDAALLLKGEIEAKGLAAFVKTSGGKGLHVVVPLKPSAGWAPVKAFAKSLATNAAKQDPDRYLAVATKAKRRGRIFIDYLRNGRGATAVAPYSTRARPGAAVSAPLEWSELSEAIGPDHFTVENMPARLAALKKDPWDGFFAAAKALPKP